MSSAVTLTAFQRLLLEIVRDKGPCEGIEVIREAKGKGSHAAGGAIYNSLGHLKEKGCLEVSLRGRRLLYEITDVGKAALTTSQVTN